MKPISTKSWIIMIAISLVFTYLEYNLFVADLDKPLSQKVLYLSIDVLHCFVYVFLFYLFWNPTCDLIQLTLLNTLYLVVVCCFYFYRRCILTILAEQGLGLTETRGWMSPTDRLYNFFGGGLQSYVPKNQETTTNWMDGNKPTIFALITMNVMCLGYHFGSLRSPKYVP